MLDTREAHPGENYRHHTSIEDRRRNARAFREQSAVCSQILLDDLGYPRIARGGLFIPSRPWTRPSDVARKLGSDAKVQKVAMTGSRRSTKNSSTKS
jgi:hypothetical protein